MSVPVLRQKRGETIAAMEALNNKAMAENRDLTPEELTQYESLKSEAESLKTQISRAEEVERLKGEAALSAANPRIELIRDKDDKGEKGWSFARVVRALAATKGNKREAAEYARETLGDAKVAKALAAGAATAGGFLVPEDQSADVIELLRERSVVRRMGAVSVPLPNGSMTMPKQSSGGSATYLGENTNIAPSEQTFGQLKLTARKLAALTAISNDLVRFASPSVDTLVRNDLVAAMALTEDANFIRGLGTGAGPKGLRYWAPTANVIAVNATVNLANVTQDLGKLWLALRTSLSRFINVGWLIAPRTENYLSNLRDGNGNKAFPEMANGRLMGYPFASTTQIPVNLVVTDTNESEIYLVDFADAIIGEALNMVIDVSDTAAYHDGSAVVAAYSLDQTVIRVITEHDFGMRHDGSVAVLKDVDWQ